ncbi:mce associated protein mas1a [Rhodococcus sp. IEGM 1379]|uniref:mce associated protein mas1a n=1 Tax=Rhodococcus sp. IEGM 1379 TaxID=3047086 RepID=UPI0024B73C6B|nr:mce associated protein mas1a [Rhodococcus sp. IEGM 1379]MDI9916533.1 mce associated protein mas1a [Rhodococcus sp. IEGM 1379]
MAPVDTAQIEIVDIETAEKPRRRSFLTAVLAIVLVGALAALAFQMLSARTENSLRTEAMDTAREYSIIMSSFDYQNLDANKDKIASMSTESFAGTYKTMVDSLHDVVAGGQGQATATATNVGVESVDSDSATVLVFVDQEAKNVATPQGNSQKYRMVLSLVRSNDQWLVDNVVTR